MPLVLLEYRLSSCLPSIKLVHVELGFVYIDVKCLKNGIRRFMVQTSVYNWVKVEQAFESRLESIAVA